MQLADGLEAGLHFLQQRPPLVVQALFCLYRAKPREGARRIICYGATALAELAAFEVEVFSDTGCKTPSVWLRGWRSLRTAAGYNQRSSAISLREPGRDTGWVEPESSSNWMVRAISADVS